MIIIRLAARWQGGNTIKARTATASTCPLVQQVGGKEEDSEWGSQMIQDYGFRIYNPTIGKFLSVDPLSSSYPWYTPYQFAGNMPIWAIDLDGLEPTKKDINYGKNVILSNTGSLEESVTEEGERDESNENWIGFSGTGFTELSEYINKNEFNIENLVLLTHSSQCKKCALIDGNREAIGFETGLKGVYVTVDDIELYMDIQQSGGDTEEFKKGKKFPFDYDKWVENEYQEVKALDNIISSIKDGGTCILTACSIGNNTDDIMNMVRNFTENNITVIGSTELVHVKGNGKSQPFQVLNITVDNIMETTGSGSKAKDSFIYLRKKGMAILEIDIEFLKGLSEGEEIQY